MLDMCSSRAQAQITHSPVFHLTMGEPGHDVECCLCVCAGLCCVCAQVLALSRLLDILMRRILSGAAAAQWQSSAVVAC